MTVSSAQNKVSYAGDGSTTVFSVPFLFQTNADITAILRDGQGAETTWVESTDYTLTGAGNPSGGTLTATTAPGSGEKLTIKRVVPLTQGTDYPEGGQFPAQAHEDALDRGTMADQQLQEQIDRTVKLKATSALSNIDFPEPGADKGFKWNAGGTALQLTAGDPDAVNPATQAAADAAASSESAAASSESAAASSESAAAASATAASSSESAAAASATAAASSESAAASSETNAAASETDAEAAAGAVAYKWLFDSSVSMGDPGTGDVRLNNATLSAVTQIAISAKIADVGNPDVSAFIVTWDDSNHSPRGTIVIRLSGTPATFVIYSINGAITDNGIWLQIPVAHVAGNGSLTDTDKVFIHFIRSGDDGTGIGDLLAANNLSDVADVPTARANLGVPPATRAINTSGGLTGGGDLSADRMLSVAANGIDETKLKDALIADFAEVVVAAGDSFLLGDVGDGGKTKRDTIQGILDLAGGLFAEGFISSLQTLTSGGALTIAHGLGARPTHAVAELENQTAEHGYSVGDLIMTAAVGWGGPANNHGVVIVPDATNLNIRFGSGGAVMEGINKTSGASVSFNNTRWKIRFIVWR